MASLKMDVEQAGEFFRRLGRFGGTEATMRRLLGDDTYMESWVKRLDESTVVSMFEPRPDLVNGLFTPPKRVIELFGETREMRGWGEFSDRDVTRLEGSIPDWPTSGGLPGLSLRIRLAPTNTMSCVQRTFEEHTKLIRFRHDNFRRWDGVQSGPSNLRLQAGNDTHKAVVEWCAIDFNPEGTQAPRDLRRPGLVLPADEILAASWLHRNLIEAIHDPRRKNPLRHLWAPGYELNVSGGDPWQDVPHVRFDRDARNVELDDGWYDDVHSHWAVPLFVRE